MRGTLWFVSRYFDHNRIIPAHAGNSSSVPVRLPMMADHPRACGELPRFNRCAPVDIGSSPRMRGTRLHPIARLAQYRIIPAHAGNSATDGIRPLSTSDHPRACGELRARQRAAQDPLGSSPRMRGTRLLLVSRVEPLRIIPAHAGNSHPEHVALVHSADHPRACGELRDDPQNRSTSAGSSPRMRGTPGHHHGEEPVRRIIPAHAGNSASTRETISRPPDHPRACGELELNAAFAQQLAGSSPRMRGTLQGTAAQVRVIRIIPAHAGNSPRHFLHTYRTSDHPRACGELLTSLTLLESSSGSSPRMRGTLPMLGCQAVNLRIIPAHAGNS